ncbi:MAG: hypothetical protein U1E49_05360 [Hyphomicrobiaceae bacterium]
MPKVSIAVLSTGLVAGLLLAAPAEAAMRNCVKLVVGQATAATELAAKKQAMDDWKKSAVAAGIEHPAWRIAANKSFKCETEADGQFTCTASGDPCTITQVPAAPAATN